MHDIANGGWLSHHTHTIPLSGNCGEDPPLIIRHRLKSEGLSRYAGIEGGNVTGYVVAQGKSQDLSRSAGIEGGSGATGTTTGVRRKTYPASRELRAFFAGR